MLAKQMPVDSHWLSSEGLDEEAALPVLRVSTPRKQNTVNFIASDDGGSENGLNKVKDIRGGGSSSSSSSGGSSDAVDVELSAKAKALSLEGVDTVFVQVSP
jgi:hypothetical protein